MADNRAIAVLDTGAGGLSVVNALRVLLPHEEIHYFADYAHLPYGLKSPSRIRMLALNAVKNFIALNDYKMLIIACHTISVVCLKEIQAMLDIPVIGMLEPTIEGLKQFLPPKNLQKFAIISTKATLQSQAYRRHWHFFEPTVELFEQACGPLVSLIEEQSVSQEQLTMIVRHLLRDDIKNADALMIGCTHFSAFTGIFKTILKQQAIIVDAADFVAAHVAKELKNASLLTSKTYQKPLRAFVSDNPERFSLVRPCFIEESMDVELLP